MEVDALAQYLNLSRVDAAETFYQRRNGAPRCEQQEPNDARQLLCPADARFLVTKFSGTTVGGAFAQPITASRMTRAYCQTHAAENAVRHHGWIHSPEIRRRKHPAQRPPTSARSSPRPQLPVRQPSAISPTRPVRKSRRPQPALRRKATRNPVADHRPPPTTTTTYSRSPAASTSRPWRPPAAKSSPPWARSSSATP